MIIKLKKCEIKNNNKTYINLFILSICFIEK